MASSRVSERARIHVHQRIYIHREECVVQRAYRLIFLAARQKRSILDCAVVETSFIKLNIARSASDNHEKHLVSTHTHTPTTFDLHRSFVRSFSSCCCTTPLSIDI